MRGVAGRDGGGPGDLDQGAASQPVHLDVEQLGQLQQMLARDVGAAGLPMTDLLLADAENAADLRLRQARAATGLLDALAQRREPGAKTGDHGSSRAVRAPHVLYY